MENEWIAGAGVGARPEAARERMNSLALRPANCKCARQLNCESRGSRKNESGNGIATDKPGEGARCLGRNLRANVNKSPDFELRLQR